MTAREAFEELIGIIPDVETHGDAIAALNDAIGADDQSIADLTSERDQLIAERDDFRNRYENAAAEIRRRWTDRSTDTTITKTSDFTGPAPEEVENVRIEDFDIEKNFFNGGTE